MSDIKGLSLPRTNCTWYLRPRWSSSLHPLSFSSPSPTLPLPFLFFPINLPTSRSEHILNPVIITVYCRKLQQNLQLKIITEFIHLIYKYMEWCIETCSSREKSTTSRGNFSHHKRKHFFQREIFCKLQLSLLLIFNGEKALKRRTQPFGL